MHLQRVFKENAIVAFPQQKQALEVAELLGFCLKYGPETSENFVINTMRLISIGVK